MEHDHDDATPHVPGDCPWTHLRDLADAVLAADWLAGWKALCALLAHASTCEAPVPAMHRYAGIGKDRASLAQELRLMADAAEAEPAKASWLDTLLMLLPVVLEWMRRK